MAIDILLLRSKTQFENCFQFIFLEIQHRLNPNDKFLISYIYRPPFKDNRLSLFISEYRKALNEIRNNNLPLIIAGDTNIDYYDIDNNPVYNEFFDMMSMHSLTPRIFLPTRISSSRCSLLDHIIYTRANSRSTARAGIIVTDFSDHYFTFCHLISKSNRNTTPKYPNILK